MYRRHTDPSIDVGFGAGRALTAVLVGHGGAGKARLLLLLRSASCFEFLSCDKICASWIL